MIRRLTVILFACFTAVLGAGAAGDPDAAVTGDLEAPATWKPAQAELTRLGDGFLVWESKRTGTWQIWTMSLDGTGLKQLTTADKSADQECPKISPDGTRVAFLSMPVNSPSGGGQPTPSPLHLINRDGSGDHVIVTNAVKYGGWNRAVVWFNDHELAYISGADGNTYRLNLTTGQSTLLFKTQHGLLWLPNVKLDHVVESFNQVSRLDKEKQTITAMPSLGGCQPYPTADGNWVVWNHVCGGPIGKVNLGTGAVSDFALRMPGGYSFIYFSMVSANMHLLACGGCQMEHHIGGYAGAEDSWYEIFVTPLDPKTLELAGKTVRYTFGSKTTNRFPDVWQADPALGFQSDKAPYTASFSAKDMRGDWTWDYGDGAKETAAAGKHLYAKPGTYVVSATQGDRVLHGQVTVKDPTPPTTVGTLVENIKEVAISFSEPMNLEHAKYSLASGTRIERAEPGAGGRMVRLFLAARLTKDDRVHIEGATDLAQKPNPLAGADVTVKASFWPDNPARSAFVWETADKPNLVRDPFSGEMHSFTTEWRYRSWKDHDYAMVCDGGMCNIVGIRDVWFNDIRQSDHPGQISFECTLTPRTVEPARQIVSTFGLVQKKDHLFLDDHDLGAVVAGKACHVLLASGNGELRGYLNGTEVLNVKKDWSFEGWMTFGSALYNQPWYGTIEGIALYNRVLTADEAKAECEAYQKLRAARKPVASVQVEAEVTELSRVSTPAQITPYVKALAYFDYKVRKVISGKLDATKIRVAHWTVLDRDATRISTLPVGAIMRLTLERTEDNPQIEGDQTDDTLPIDDTPRFLATQEARVGTTGINDWKLLPSDVAKAESMETMSDIAGNFKPPEGQAWKVVAQDAFSGMIQPIWMGFPGTVYALSYVTSPKEQTGLLSLYTAATTTVWLNGRLLTTLPSSEIGRYPFTANRRVPITLKKGVNQLLLKTTNESGNMAFACDLMNPQGLEMTGLTYSVEPK